MNLQTHDVAFFKRRTTSSIPIRDGPVQFVRFCSNCFRRKSDDHNREQDEFVDMKSFDDLISRLSIWSTQYQSIQYHPGQCEIVRKIVKKNSHNIFIVALTSRKDLDYVNLVFDHTRIAKLKPHRNNGSINLSSGTITLLTKIYTSIEESSQDEFIMSVLSVWDAFNPLVKRGRFSFDLDPKIIPMVVTRDHRTNSTLGMGSISIQILEPFSLQDFISCCSVSELTSTLVKHIYHDLSSNALVLPTQLVSFLVLNLNRDDGVSMKDLTYYIDWFRKNSMTFNMHLGFNGTALDVANFAIYMLDDVLGLQADRYYAKDIEKLTTHAKQITQVIAKFGLVATAILREYNAVAPTNFTPQVVIRVSHNDVVDRVKEMLYIIEKVFHCRKPCKPVSDFVNDIIYQMEIFFGYLEVQEPKMRARKRGGWADVLCESDDEYIQSNKDNPAFMSWILVSPKERKLDQMNLFKIAVEPYLMLQEP